MHKGSINAWNMPTATCNRLIAERMEFRRHEKHLHALGNTRGMVDTRKPQDQAHLISKPKTKKLQEDRAAEIQLENRILLQKMLNIDTKPSQVSCEFMSGHRVQPKSLHGGAQRRERDRIMDANQDLLKRLQSTKPSITPRGWEDEEVDRQALKFRLCQNSCRGRVPRLRVPERSMNDSRLPRLGSGSQSARYADEEWSGLTNAELDQHLRNLERNQGYGAAQQALTNM